MIGERLVVLLLAAGANLLLAGVVWLRDRSCRINQYFAMFAAAVAFWTLSAAVTGELAGTWWGLVWARAAFAAASLIPVAFLLFVGVFPSKMPVGARLPSGALIGTGLAVTAVSFGPWMVKRTALVDGALSVTYGPLHPIFGLYFVCCLAWGLLCLARKQARLKGIERLQVRYVFLGVASAGLGATITNLVIPVIAGSSRLSLYGPLFGILLIAILGHSVVRFRLMDIRVVVSRGVTYGLAVAVAAGVFLSLAWVAARWVVARPPALEFALVLLIGLVFQPLRRWIQARVDRYFFRERYDYARIVRETSRNIATTLDLQALLEYVCGIIVRAVRPERVAVYMSDPTRAGEFQAVVVRDGVGGDAEGGLTTQPCPALAAWLARGREYLLADEIGQADTGPASRALEELRRLGGEAAFRILEAGRVAGFFLVGPKRSGDAYLREDVQLLITVTSQAAIAIGNARLHRQVLRVEGDMRRAERLAAVGSFASGVAHEIRNPLVAIKTFAELLPRRFEDAEFRGEFAGVVSREIDRINEMITRLLGVARSAARELVAVDLREPLEETLTLLRPQFERAGIHVERVYDARKTVVAGDGGQLQQLFLNLFMNAAEAMGEGGRLTIRLLNHRSLDSEMVVVEVEDTGPGISNGIIDRIFEPFVTTKPHGSGLGLSICRSITDAHRAGIRAWNNVGRPGATIAVEFAVRNERQPERRAGGEEAGRREADRGPVREAVAVTARRDRRPGDEARVRLARKSRFRRFSGARPNVDRGRPSG